MIENDMQLAMVIALSVEMMDDYEARVAKGPPADASQEVQEAWAGFLAGMHAGIMHLRDEVADYWAREGPADADLLAKIRGER